jgi:beta-lactamase class D
MVRVMASLILLFFAWPATSQEWRPREDWGKHFAAAGVSGTIAVLDERSSNHWVFNARRAGTRFATASTFKLPHALFALDAGVVRDEFQVIPWDGTRHAIPAWNRDQDLRSSMRNSTVWVYQDFARAIGREREREYLERLDYGNADASGELSEFWLNGTLRISAFEQIAFLRRLYRNSLPFAVEHQRLVKDLAIVAAGSDWILRAKTGWGVRVEPQVGWWVGWVERPEGAIFFALNIETRDAADLPKREGIARQILREIGALPVHSPPP